MQMTTTPQAEEASMNRFEFRRDFADGTFDVTAVEARSIADADAVARRAGDVDSTTLLAIVDLEPIRPLVVFT